MQEVLFIVNYKNKQAKSHNKIDLNTDYIGTGR